jgi:tetratricopeptide (TPR) repeat protein
MRLLLILLGTAALTACAATPKPQAQAPATEAAAVPAGVGEAAGPYGLFLAGNAALSGGRAGEAEALFARAAAAMPDNSVLRNRTFAAALASGDIAKAASLAPLEGDADARSLGRLTKAVHALASGRGKEAQAALGGEPLAGAHGLTAALVKPWTAAAAGDLAGALDPGAEGPEAAALVAALGQLGRIDLLDRAGRHAEADALVAKFDAVQAPVQVVLRHGGYLERRRRSAEAAALYERALQARADEPALQAALARARTGRDAPPPFTFRQGAAQALLVPAVVLAGARQTEPALAYLRMALHLDPELDEAWVMVGEVLSTEGDLDGARRAFLKPKAGSPHFTTARSRLAYALQEKGRTAEALEVARAAAAAAPADSSLQTTYGALLIEQKRFDEAVAVFDRLIAAQGERDWRTWFLRGTAHERAGRWAQAERDLQRARTLSPEEPEVLNYLGYTWVDRGERLQEAFGMIERAVQLRPRSGAIVDSLGWAHYRLGRFPEAVKALERAAELEPGDPTINDHLGDAYWRVGRVVEAHFQWRRVLTLQPEPAVRAAAEAKLASPAGPDAVARAVAAAP